MGSQCQVIAELLVSSSVVTVNTETRTEDQYIIGKQEQSRRGLVSGETMPVTV